MARILEALERHRLFRGLPREALRDLVVDCRLRTPRRGDPLFAAGEPAEAFHVVARGRVRLYSVSPDGREHGVDTCGPGDAFGLLAALGGGRYPVHAAAATDAAVVRVPVGAFLRLRALCPDLEPRVERELEERVRRLRVREEPAEPRRVRARVAAHLLRLAADAARAAAGGDGHVADLGGTRADVAAALGTVREVFIRHLRRLEREGIVRIADRRVEILDAGRLREAAEG